MFNPSFVSNTPASVVGTWTAVNTTLDGQTALAVVQFKPDGTFVEGFDLANHASTYLGRYSFDTNSQRISFIIDSAAGDGPQPIPFHQAALSSHVSFGIPTVRLNNDLTFTFETSSVSPSDFVLPAPTMQVNSPFRSSGMFDNNFGFNHNMFFPHFFF